ncbi:MAG: hypothetical protein ACLQIB_11550 [Isosphaeraceae bacterium]
MRSFGERATGTNGTLRLSRPLPVADGGRLPIRTLGTENAPRLVRDNENSLVAKQPRRTKPRRDIPIVRALPIA